MTNPINEQVAQLQAGLTKQIDQAFLTWLGAADIEDAVDIAADLAKLGVRPVIEYGSPKLADPATEMHGFGLSLETTVRFRYVPIEPTE